jgi:glycosyltransferase involved in cell wall biosynthesis
MIEIVSWHPVLTDHQSHTLQALQRAAGARLTVIVAREEDPMRKAQGWNRADAGELSVHLLGAHPDLDVVRRCLDRHAQAVHLFGSPFDTPWFMVALFMALWRDLPVYLISEPYSTNDAGYLDDQHPIRTRLKALLRPWVYRIYGLLLRRRVKGVFAISPLAVAQYRAIGVPAASIHPFGYFVPAQDPTLRAMPSPDRRPCRVVFVGSLIRRKGVAELVAAARQLHAEGVDLEIDVYGPGQPDAFDIDGRGIRYAGRIPFGTAQEVIAPYDALVLPSRYDGWGVVVNEAVVAGVPVICSDRVGAGAFVRRWGCGLTFPAGSAEALARALRALATDVCLRNQLRDACIAARDKLSPQVAGRYMADVISGVRAAEPAMSNPWYDAP